MSEIEIVTKGVSFNVKDPDQKAQYEHAMKRKNFSGYVKRLIQRDMDNRFVPTNAPQTVKQPPSNLDEGLMEGLI